MPIDDKKLPIVRAADRTTERELQFSHPLNPRSDIHGFLLASAVGLKNVGVFWARVPPGKESFVYHRHHGEEEFIYVLTGRCIVELDDGEHEVGPGDFVGFPAGTAHHLRNPFAEDVTYLSGGESRSMEIADFPRHGQRMVRVGGKMDLYTVDDKPPPFPGVTKL